MRFGYFDDVNKEYVVERPDTPRSWINYSGSPQYGALITNNAGGYSFNRSSAAGRFLRQPFNAIPADQPGRYLYLHDHGSHDYWSASWQPVGKALDAYRTTCRFGTSYTIIESEYDNVQSETTYFVPLGQCFEYWRLRLTNKDDKARKLSVFTYCEFASEWNIFQDHFNLQYSAYTVKAEWRENMIRCASVDNVPPDPDNFANTDQGRWAWMALVGNEVHGYDMDRETFIGPYRNYGNPIAVEKGACSDSIAYGDNACGGMQTTITLQPGETRELLVLLGVGKAENEGVEIRNEFGSFERAEQELIKLKKDWHGRLGNFIVDTPDEDFNHMINVWNAYNALVTFYWSRAASLVYSGDQRDGFGYRDTVQDVLGVLPSIADEARERLELMITGQESTGGARPEVKPFSHKPGHMELTPPEKYRSDDSLWLFNSVPAYIAESGDLDFYKKVLPYSDKGEDTVLGHLRRAIEFSLNRRGAHGLVCGLMADWNDCLKLGFNGESVFVTFQLRYALKVYAEITSKLLEMPTEAVWANEQLAEVDRAIQKSTWDGEWFVRAYRDDGSVIGSSENDEGKIFLNPQSWAVLSSAANEEQAKKALDSIEKQLATENGIMVCTPPFQETDYHVVRAVLMNPGHKENGGIFSHTQGWAVMADCHLGNGDRAYKYYRAFMPSRYNDTAELREIEPFVHCQSTNSKFSKKPGVSRIPWLSGTASWAYYSATSYILGVRPAHDGLVIDPCIPSDWKSFTMKRVLRGKEIMIRVENPNGVQKGVEYIVINDTKVEGSFIGNTLLKDQNDVRVVMG